MCQAVRELVYIYVGVSCNCTVDQKFMFSHKDLIDTKIYMPFKN